MTQSPEALPDRLRDVEHLEEVMTTPSAALIAALQELPGDIIILGVVITSSRCSTSRKRSGSASGDWVIPAACP